MVSFLLRGLSVGAMALVLGGEAFAESCDPAADPAATVACGKARFTVLTDRLIRLEWSADGAFEDRASLAVVNRRLPVPKFTAKRIGEGVTIETDRLKLVYAGGRFSPETLSASFDGGAWRFGDKDGGNLKGTFPTLDGFDGDHNIETPEVRDPLEPGVVSRSGWAVVDESARHVFDRLPGNARDSIVCRPAGDRTDAYLFAYGHDYKAAVRDYVRIAGRIPLPPRWAFGYWWSRYWTYSDREIRNLVEEMQSVDVPIDVVIIDMDWHKIWGLVGKCEFGGWENGWTGYSWNRSLFPDSKNLFDWIHGKGCVSALNIHPASGIKPNEDCYRAFAADYGWTVTNAIPFRLDEEKWADCWFKDALGPIEKEGVDFWWMDWQQWPTSRLTEGLSNIFLLNHVMMEHMAGLGRRPMIYHRYGGLGSHRYQVGFSGDTYATWEMLAYLPRYTSTAGNVGYGYWGHDVGGFVQKEDTTDPELYTRWLQYGVFTPIFKTHCTKNAKIERRIWRFPEHFTAMREAIRMRYRLAPYVYTAARQAYDTGLSMCRPLYWEWPEEAAAYDPTLTEYLFGDDILAFAVASKTDATTGLAPVRLWIPEGTWYDMATGESFTGPQTVTNRYAIEELPFLARAGAVIPMNADGVKNLKGPMETLVLTCVPGAAHGETAVYEDDGTGADYATRCAWTRVAVDRTQTLTTVRVAPREDAYAGMPEKRGYEFRFPCEMPPEKVVVDGTPLPYSRFGGTDTWTYDGYSLEVRVQTSEKPCAEGVVAELRFSQAAADARPLLAGLQKRFRREANDCERYKLEYEQLPQEKRDWRALEDRFSRVGLPSAITERPQEILDLLKRSARVVQKH